MRALIVATAIALTGAIAPVDAAPSTVVAALGSASGVVQPMGVTAGGEVSFVNADVEWHFVVAVDTGPSDNAWCDDRPEFARGCPLFFADLTPHSGGVSVIQGAEELEGGRVYGFTCLVHPQIEGALFAL